MRQVFFAGTILLTACGGLNDEDLVAEKLAYNWNLCEGRDYKQTFGWSDQGVSLKIDHRHDASDHKNWQSAKVHGHPSFEFWPDSSVVFGNSLFRSVRTSTSVQGFEGESEYRSMISVERVDIDELKVLKRRTQIAIDPYAYPAAVFADETPGSPALALMTLWLTDTESGDTIVEGEFFAFDPECFGR